MFDVLLSYSVISIALLAGEFIGKLYFKERPEFTRKLIHMLGGLAAASLILFLTTKGIVLVSASCVVVMLLIRKTKFLGGLYDVGRNTWGEVLFPVGVGIAALTAQSTTAYVFAIAVLTFGDTIAAFIGTHYAKRYFKIFGSKKSVVGSIALFLSVMVIGMCTVFISGLGQSLSLDVMWHLAVVASCCTVAELAGAHGFDNITLPLVAVLSWNILF